MLCFFLKEGSSWNFFRLSEKNLTVPCECFDVFPRKLGEIFLKTLPGCFVIVNLTAKQGPNNLIRAQKNDPLLENCFNCFKYNKKFYSTKWSNTMTKKTH